MRNLNTQNAADLNYKVLVFLFHRFQMSVEIFDYLDALINLEEASKYKNTHYFLPVSLTV